MFGHCGYYRYYPIAVTAITACQLTDAFRPRCEFLQIDKKDPYSKEYTLADLYELLFDIDQNTAISGHERLNQNDVDQMSDLQSDLAHF
jgi:hypothetical protein